MKVRQLNPVALGVAVVVAVLVAVTTVLSAGREPVFDTVLFGFQSLAWATVGLLVVSRQPGNPVGWVFCASAVFSASSNLAQGWALAAVDAGLPGGVMGAWVSSWIWVPDATMLTLVLLLFPDGRLVSRHWRVALWLAAGGCLLAVPGYALSQRTGALIVGSRNPFAVDSAAVDVLYVAGNGLFLCALLAAVGSFVVRLRRARGVVRQQLKWFGYAAVLLGAVAPFAIVFWGRSSLVDLPIVVALAGLPVAAGIGILRYRLYDIDILLNRTLVYAVLTALLTLVYGGGVFLLGGVLSPGAGNSQLAVAASTLAVAALFQPFRRRVQAVVDRRFNRRRYDAVQTVEAFSARLRDEVDLDTLSVELVAVLARTMQPARAALWLRR